MNLCASLAVVLVVLSLIKAPSPVNETISDDVKLFKLNGVWLFVEDRTEGRPVEDGKAPIDIQFTLRVQEDGVYFVRPHHEAKDLVMVRPRAEERITFDGSEVVVRETNHTYSRYTGQWNQKENSLEYAMEISSLIHNVDPTKLKWIFNPTEEGLLVSVISETGSKQVALYRHPEDIQMPEPVKAKIADVDWLTGDWVRADANSEIEEQWIEAKGRAMLGLSRRTSDEQMTGFEFMVIRERDESLVYMSQPEGREPTRFVLTELSESRVVFLNPLHDYPQRIVYERTEDGGLKASHGFAKGRLVHFQFTADSK